MLHALGHVLLHMGPGFGMIAVIVWAMWRAGQLGNPARAAALPLEIAGPPYRPDSRTRRRRVPIVAITLAIVMGIGIGIPIAAVVLGSRIQVTSAENGGVEEGH